MSEENHPISNDELGPDPDHGQVSEDDLYDALSPTDGYFGTHSQDANREGVLPQPGPRADEGKDQRSSPRVPNVMVEDPSIRQNTAEAKAEEAAAEASSAPAQEGDASPEPVVDTNRPQPRQPESQTLEPRSPVQPQQSTNLVSSSSGRYMPYPDAPPAYTPGTRGSYGTIQPAVPSSSDHVPEEQQALLSDPDPISATSPPPPGEIEAQGSIFPYWANGKSKARVRNGWCILFFLILLLTVVVIFIYAMPQSSTKTIYFEEPIAPPPEIGDEPLKWDSPGRCGTEIRERVHAGHSWSFNPNSVLTVLQITDDQSTGPDPSPVYVSGEFIIRSTTGFFPAGYISVESIANFEYAGTVLNLDTKGDIITFASHKAASRSGGYDPCLKARMILWVPADARVSSLEARIQQLDIVIEEGLSMSVHDILNFIAYEGTISAPVRDEDSETAPYKLAATGIGLSSYKNKISGWYPLYEALALISTGEIDVSSTQKIIRSGPSRPAEVVVESELEDVHFHQLAAPMMPKKAVSRDYTASIKSGDGDVHAELLHYSSAKVGSLYGNLNLTLTSALGSDCRSWGHSYCIVDTQTNNGSQHVVVTHPESAPGGEDSGTDREDVHSVAGTEPIDRPWLISVHQSSGGDIEAQYPGSWEGTIKAVTFTGNMSFIGEGLTTKLEKSVGERLLGVKGNTQNSMMRVATHSGNQAVFIGPREPHAVH